MKISVIIPAHNSAETIAETLHSLQVQTFSDWEAIVVNDGSGDRTAEIVANFAAQDNRIRIVSQPHGGESVARNTGFRLARFDWLLFLDSDDWILPEYLERMTSALTEDPSLDAVHCGWVRVTPERTIVAPRYQPPAGDLFHAFARYPAFVIHACIVRRSLVEAAGGFDTSLRTCPDWDLWQRIARTGARFGAIQGRLACYRMRPNAASLDSLQMLTDGLRVITQGYSPDSRVPNPHPAHANGVAGDDLARSKFHRACWTAGLMLGRGEDFGPVFEILGDIHDPGLDPRVIAEIIFDSVPLSTCQPPTAWDKLWSNFETLIDEFLLALEAHSLAPKLARRTRSILESMILQTVMSSCPLTVGRTHGIRIEITEAIVDLRFTTAVDHLFCMVELEGLHIGTIELPVCNGFVPRYVLADAISADFAWRIVGRFFEHNIYPNLRVEREPTGLSLYRKHLCLAKGLPDHEGTISSWVHDHVGWTVFLQELWGHPDWPLNQFDDPQSTNEPAIRRYIEVGWVPVEVSEDLPEVEVPSKTLEVHVLVTVAGIAVAVVTLPVIGNVINAQSLRSAITQTCGFELCRIAVREVLLGKPLKGADPLRLQLRESTSRSKDSTDRIEPVNVDRVPNWGRGINGFLSSETHAILLARRVNSEIGTSVCRRAILPAEAANELVEVASLAGEPVFRVGDPDEQPTRLAYAPDLIWIRSQRSLRNDSYERVKTDQVLSSLPDTPFGIALQLGCGEGHLTVKLAPRVGWLTAVDFSQLALDRASEESIGFPNINFLQLDIQRDPLPNSFDLIVCNEALYHLDSKETLKDVARKLADALLPGGYLLAIHARIVKEGAHGFDWALPFGAKGIGRTLAHTAPLRFVKELQTPFYSIQLFRHSRRHKWLRLPRRTIKLKEPSSAPEGIPTPDLRHIFRRRENDAPTVTEKLPILMYHRVAASGSPAAARYRVTTEAFGEQMRYLYDAGFYTISLKDWHRAWKMHKPLPGRAVLLTFDDGYQDFYTNAWPVLKEFNFSALVFLVAEEIGGSNRWDRVWKYGEEVQLLDWRQIIELQKTGIEFGSHSATHRYLTGLSVEEVVREGVHSRAVLQRGLGRPVTTFAYPYGAENRAVQHLIGGCGYIFGLSTRYGLAGFNDPLLSLPRIEIAGRDRLDEFIRKLHP